MLKEKDENQRTKFFLYFSFFVSTIGKGIACGSNFFFCFYSAWLAFGHFFYFFSFCCLCLCEYAVRLLRKVHCLILFYCSILFRTIGVLWRMYVRYTQTDTTTFHMATAYTKINIYKYPCLSNSFWFFFFIYFHVFFFFASTCFCSLQLCVRRLLQ